MKLYRVDLHSDELNSQGFTWCTSWTEANRVAAEFRKNYEEYIPDPVIEEVEFQLTKSEVLRLLRTYGNHPDNG